MQMLDTSVEQMSRAVNLDLRERYEKFGIREIIPKHDFDFRRDQLIPGRRRMIENFHRIERVQGEVSRCASASTSPTRMYRRIAMLLWPPMARSSGSVRPISA